MSKELPNPHEIEFLLNQLNGRQKHYRRGKKKQLQFMKNSLKLLNEVYKQPNVLSDDHWKQLSRRNRSHEVTYLYNDWVDILKNATRNPPKTTDEGASLAEKYDLWTAVFRQSHLFEKDLFSLSGGK